MVQSSLVSVKYNFIRFRLVGFICSLILVLASVGLVLTKGLEFGIDFTGGIVMELRFDDAPNMGDLRTLLETKLEGDVALQHLGSPQDVMIRVQGNSKGVEGNAGAAAQSQQVLMIKEVLADYQGEAVTYRKVDYVGPQVSGELLQDGIIALLLAFVGIMLYVWFRFEWQFGVGAIIALIHDSIITLGFFALMGIEFNLSSVAAVLTIIGYSINDSVVIYDRIRENLRKYKKMPLGELLNVSINETLSRTLLTAGTTLVALLALVLLGGPVIEGFALAILFGIVIGTYSSIYVAAPALLYLDLRRQHSRPVAGNAQEAGV